MKIKAKIKMIRKIILMKHRFRKAKIKYIKGAYIGKNVINMGADVILSDSSVVCDNVTFWGSGKIIIGKNSSIGFNSSLHSNTNGGVEIGNNVIIGQRLNLIDSNHSFSKKDLICKQPMISKKIIIEDDVWIGSNVTILMGTIIRRHSVVGACSLCNREYDGNSLILGIPAKIKKTI